MSQLAKLREEYIRVNESMKAVPLPKADSKEYHRMTPDKLQDLINVRQKLAFDIADHVCGIKRTVVT